MNNMLKQLLQAIKNWWEPCEHQRLVLVSRQPCYASEFYPVNFELKTEYTYKCMKCGERKVFFMPYETSDIPIPSRWFLEKTWYRYKPIDGWDR